jgi:hypothetical protein
MNEIDVRNIIEDNLEYIEDLGCYEGAAEAKAFLDNLDLQNISISNYDWAISHGLVESSIIEEYFNKWLNDEDLPIFVEWLFGEDHIIDAIVENYPELIADSEKLYNHSYWSVRSNWAEITKNEELIKQRFFVEEDAYVFGILFDKLDLKGEIVDCDFSKGYISSFDYRYFNGKRFVTDTFDNFDDDVLSLSDDIIGEMKYLSVEDLRIIYKYIGG